eukprot:m.62475 g.62475  ORF g.62475 m.62475 type:complete len:424 (-) comp19367_c0_seq4:25-1296(-)
MWSCAACTFSNKDNAATCQICGQIAVAPGTWFCPQCTLANPRDELVCNACFGPKPEQDNSAPDSTKSPPAATTAAAPPREIKSKPPSSSSSSINNADSKALTKQPSMSSNDNAYQGLSQKRPLNLAPAVGREDSRSKRRRAAGGGNAFVLLTWNVWFNEEAEVQSRMKAIGKVIAEEKPTFVCFQEVTPLIDSLLRSLSWASNFFISAAPSHAPYYTLLCVKKNKFTDGTKPAFKRTRFSNSIMGRDMLYVVAPLGSEKVCVCTSHLESPIVQRGPEQGHYSKERKAQLEHVLQTLSAVGVENLVFAGDMNWNDKRDGETALPPGWLDVWKKIHPAKSGETYDGKVNGMLAGSRFRGRLDRVFVKTKNFHPNQINMVGKSAIPGLFMMKQRRSQGQTFSFKVPILPSDHFGLLVEFGEGKGMD